ncbi:unnamed protein product [Didymodactylos carnosus]|uniref:Uncharacterized protein n=1 Tax=Didymodactylos carnosus TaxID=1234261 RepID=A0A815GNP1_9BILA|nr:unnamed protein product [Didymodactylos carnosus]CAF4204495.1 unnamed protein product [Didymodactylos carnosus]
MFQSLITIWLDQVYDTAPTSAVKINSATHLSLCKIDPYLITFRDSDECIDYITDLKEDETKVVLIISISNAISYLRSDVLFQLGDQLLQVDSLYVLFSNDTNIETFEPSKKVQGLYTDTKSLRNQLYQLPYLRQKRREGFVRADFSITSLSTAADPCSSTAATITNQPISVPIKRQEAEFMYAQFLRDILIEIESTEEEIIEFCREKCVDNQTELKVIEEFKDYYDACNAIFWYTRDTFLYRLLNKALREQDIDALYSLRYFIKDLHLQLKEQHILQQTLTVAEDAATSIIETV